MSPSANALMVHKEALITVIAVVGATLLYLMRKLYQSRKYHLKELKALGLYQENTKDVMNEKTGLKERRISSKIKVRWNGNKLVFLKYNRAYGIKNFENLRPNLETLFGKKIELITHENQWWSSQPRIILHTEAFPKKFLLSQRPKLNVGQLFLGMDALNRPVILETIKDHTNTLICFAPKGSGKSVLINGMLTSFFETLEEHGRLDEYELIIADNKGTDFIEVADRFKGSYYQPFNLHDLRELVGRLRQYKEEIESTLTYLRANKISVPHWDLLRTKDAKFYIPKKLVWVIDEGKSIFGSGRSAPKLSKEPTADELARLEKHSLTQECGSLLDYFAQSGRSTGLLLIFASQSPNKSDYDYPDLLNFPVMVLGQCNAQQSIQLIGDTSLNDNTLTKGKFVIRDEVGTRRFLAPLSINIGGGGDGSK